MLLHIVHIGVHALVHRVRLPFHDVRTHLAHRALQRFQLLALRHRRLEARNLRARHILLDLRAGHEDVGAQHRVALAHIDGHIVDGREIDLAHLLHRALGVARRHHLIERLQPPQPPARVALAALLYRHDRHAVGQILAVILDVAHLRLLEARSNLTHALAHAAANQQNVRRKALGCRIERPLERFLRRVQPIFTRIQEAEGRRVGRVQDRVGRQVLLEIIQQHNQRHLHGIVRIGRTDKQTPAIHRKALREILHLQPQQDLHVLLEQRVRKQAVEYVALKRFLIVAQAPRHDLLFADQRVHR